MSFFVKAAQGAAEIAARENVKKFGKQIVKDVGVGIAWKGAKGAGNIVVDSTKKLLSDKKEKSEKYANIRKLFTSTSVDLEDFKNGIAEASSMVKFYQYDLNALNKFNPAYIANSQRLTSQHKKWDTLLNNLRKEAADKIIKEATITYESKNESDFFIKFPEINSELLILESRGEISELILKINRHYLKDFQATTNKD